MSSPVPIRSAVIREALQEHVTRRLNETLSKITGADATAEKERKKQRDFFQLQPLLESDAKCIKQVQIATHIVKGIHPEPQIRVATNLNVNCASLPALPLVGSHALGSHVHRDATGNGAFNKRVHELSLLLLTPIDGQSFLRLLQDGDAAAIAALSDSSERAAELAENLAAIDAPRCEQLASHALAKQLYWLVGSDPHDDSAYHLLAPLYPTSLVHRVYQTLQRERFSEEAKAAREARKAGQWHERPVREYPNLAIQKLGGTQPQNVSQLNSERRGNNFLLASLPPVWRSPKVRPVLGVSTLFKVFRFRPEARRLIELLRRFLEDDPARNQESRARRDGWVDALLDDLMQFTAELQTLEPGWTADPGCLLPAAQRAWLDPDGVEDISADVIEEMARDFANWLNHELRQPLPMGDAEYLHWRSQARDLFKAMEREVVL